MASVGPDRRRRQGGHGGMGMASVGPDRRRRQGGQGGMGGHSPV